MSPVLFPSTALATPSADHVVAPASRFHVPTSFHPRSHPDRPSRPAADDDARPCSSNAKPFSSNGARLAACLPGASKPAPIRAQGRTCERRTPEDEHPVHHSFSNSTRPFLPTLLAALLALHRVPRFSAALNDRSFVFLSGGPGADGGAEPFSRWRIDPRKFDGFFS